MSDQTDGTGELPELDAVEQRILGSLLEKERTVPASYPMTLNGLRTACNQSSSREPVMDLDESTIESTLDGLKAKGLARMVYASSGARTVKFRQVLDERLGLTSAERAVLTVLLLRGPQAPGELKTRTERLHGFADRHEVEVLLTAMAAAPEPLVHQLERLPGQQDHRWIHLLGPVDSATPALTPTSVPAPALLARDAEVASPPDVFEQLPFDGDVPLPEVADEPDEATEVAADQAEVETPVESEPPERTAARSFQASAGIQGRQFAEQCDTLLTHFGFELKGRRVLTEVGVEIDQEAVSPAGTTVWFEYKGSIQGKRPGLIRTDTLKKAIANGALLRSLSDPAPYVVVTSHLPEAGSGAAMLDAALRLRYFADVVCLYDPKATARLSDW